MDTTVGNRAIAELKGYDFSFDKEKEYYLINKSGELLYATFHKESYDREVEKEFNYHSDWNKLMPVVEHIESMGYYNTIEKILHRKDDVYRSWFYKKRKTGLLRLANTEHEKKITAIWLAVVAFIQWYNEKK